MKKVVRLFDTDPSGLLSVSVCLAFLLLAVSWSFGADEKPSYKKSDEPAKADIVEKPKDAHEGSRIPLTVARDRALFMHQIYTTTLEVMHDRYFHADRSVVPARAMEDLFKNPERETGSKANWILVSLRAMSINHDPSTEFEKQAARELGNSEPAYEAVDSGVYRRATPIPLHGGCVSCHAGFNPKPSKIQKLAGPEIEDSPARP